VNLRGLDLNLLLVLDALLEEGSVTAAATRLGLSQPAVSNALRRLRETIGQRLFTRHGRSVVPTPAALALRPVVREALTSLERALFRTSQFEPQQARGVVSLAMSDYWHEQLLPPLVEHLEQNAPGLQLETAPSGEEVLAEALPRGAVDAAIFLHPRVHAGIKAEVLVSDGYVLAVRRGHRFATRTPALRELAAERHVLAAPQGPWASQLGAALHREGRTLDVALRTSQMRAAIAIVARTDYVTVLPRRVAEQMRGDLAVRLLPLPVDTDGFSLALYWHERTHDNALQRWWRALVVRLARQVYKKG
jgi:DNA-binding transcriptional LysR family regulator